MVHWLLFFNVLEKILKFYSLIIFYLLRQWEFWDHRATRTVKIFVRRISSSIDKTSMHPYTDDFQIDYQHTIQQSTWSNVKYIFLEGYFTFVGNFKCLNEHLVFNQQLPRLLILSWCIKFIDSSLTVYPKTILISIKQHALCTTRTHHTQVIILNNFLCKTRKYCYSIKCEKVVMKLCDADTKDLLTYCVSWIRFRITSLRIFKGLKFVI